MDESFKLAHAQRMQRKKATVAAAMERSQTLQGIVVLLTGNGKGKTTSAFGTLYRALGHGHRAGVVQFISGTHCTGEVTFLQHMGLLGQGRQAQVDYHAMATGFSWDSQGWSADKAAAELAWSQARRMLADASLQLVLLDELTFMLQYGYLAVAELLQAIKGRPASQTVIITGRAAAPELLALADTVSEIADTRHAFRAGVKAQPGVDF
ncbi:cob(I)yrinic acid a,c-diamide adenosyltransferase [Acidovorax sp. Be4]|uniref:Corrinoid adenosyltransferase n=1 Tax=Acidovorax bellezanensis TaxID=2976702 RepID=A0ABT2PKH8_9BURK|nr:cob(I)yrinic acid a,c-diamide adenosyltransferase [Acidovorax sp. Be4]MCT9810740.1 cob(I)yrinic acid a,c-diamide adenosyltransferase [Acidovorax sp. Be4]